MAVNSIDGRWRWSKSEGIGLRGIAAPETAVSTAMEERRRGRLLCSGGGGTSWDSGMGDCNGNSGEGATVVATSLQRWSGYGSGGDFFAAVERLCREDGGQ